MLPLLRDLGTREKRNLSMDDLMLHYTEQELDVLLNRQPKATGEWYEALKQLADNTTPRQRRRWSPIEDAFLYDTYEHLSDASIALALNIPQPEVSKHRIALKLMKQTSAVENRFVVWHNRDDFDADMEKYQLSKSRGTGLHPLL